MMALERLYDGVVLRVQAQLTHDQAAGLRRLAARRGVSVAALLREGADRVLADKTDASDEAWARAWSAVRGSRGGGQGNAAEEHDHHLADVYGR